VPGSSGQEFDSAAVEPQGGVMKFDGRVERRVGLREGRGPDKAASVLHSCLKSRSVIDGLPRDRVGHASIAAGSSQSVPMLELRPQSRLRVDKGQRMWPAHRRYSCAPSTANVLSDWMATPVEWCGSVSRRTGRRVAGGA
jgi:hypothetical protein